MAGRPPTGRGGGGRRSSPPTPPPRSPPPSLRATGAALRTHGAEGTPPLPQKGLRRGGGGCGWTCTPRAPAPPAACSRGSAADGQAHTSAPQRRADQAWGRRTTANQNSMGAAPPMIPPRTIAHSGRAEGGFRSEGAPGGAVHGPPLIPPPPGAAQGPRPNAHAGGECADDKRGARVGNRGPPPRGGAGRPWRDPAPHPPHGPASRGGAGPHPPRQGGWSPPPRSREEPEHGPLPRPSRRLPQEPRGTSEPAPTRQDAAQIAPEKAGEHEPEWYGDHAPHDQNDASDTRFFACPGKAEGRNEAQRPPALMPPPGRKNGGYGARAAPPPGTRPTAHERHSPPHGGRTAPSQLGGNRNQTAPPPRTPDGARDRGRTRGGARTTWNGPTSAQCRDRARCAGHTTQGGGGAHRGSASAHTRKGHAGTTRRATGLSSRNAQAAWNCVPASEGKGHPDGTARHTQRRTRGAGRGKRVGHNTRYRPETPAPAASAAHTWTGHCTRQGSSGALRHAPTPRLGSLRVSPRGSHWRQASSTSPAAPAPRATTH